MQMDSGSKRIADALSKAMQAENEGYHFYLMAAKSTDDPKGKKTFLLMAEEEKGHFDYLKKQYGLFLKTGCVDQAVKLTPMTNYTESHPIFSTEIKNRIGNAHYEMTALSIGIQLELSAVRFYKAEAEAAAGSPHVQKLFEELASWEEQHLAILQKEAELLKEEYWTKGGFSPF
jgi:rubrerythrin